MKKIRSSLLLTVLLASLGVQTTTTLASVIENEEQPTIETEHSEEVETPGQEEQENEEPSIEESTEDKQEPIVEEPTEDNKVVEIPEEPSLDAKEEKEIKEVEKSEPSEPSKGTTEESQSVSQPSVTQEVNYTTTTTSASSGNIRFSVVQSTQSFINQIGESARKIGQEQDLYASVMIAQAILESSNGQSALASSPNFNLFGIKGEFEGQSVSFATQEDDGEGNLYTIQSNFRKYPSYKESLNDYAKLMNEGIAGNTEFYQGVHKSKASNYQAATAFLTGKYATDIYYGEKLNGLIETYDLARFDKEKVKAETLNVDGKEVATFAVQNPMTQQTADFIVPLAHGYKISSGFEVRNNPVNDMAEHHDGIDLAVNGGTPIYASSSGFVIETGFNESAGNYVIIQHENGLFTNYFHMSEVLAIQGSNVQTGDVIGLVGTTGNSTGNHLHFGMSSSLWNDYLDPTGLLIFE